MIYIAYPLYTSLVFWDGWMDGLFENACVVYIGAAVPCVCEHCSLDNAWNPAYHCHQLMYEDNIHIQWNLEELV